MAEEIEKKLLQTEEKLSSLFKRIDDIAFYNQKKVLKAYNEARVNTQCFAGTTGYGYGDLGRETLAKVYASVFGGESAIVSPLLTCGTHTISTVLYGLLRRGDVMLSVSGQPYDTILSTIFGKDNNSLEELGVIYKQIDLLENSEFDYPKIEKMVKKLKPKMVYLQRSRGYSERNAIYPYKMKDLFELVKRLSP